MTDLPDFRRKTRSGRFAWHATCFLGMRSVINTEAGCGDGNTELLIVEAGRFCLASAVLTKEEI